jgi:hypothetical protein
VQSVRPDGDWQLEVSYQHGKREEQQSSCHDISQGSSKDAKAARCKRESALILLA